MQMKHKIQGITGTLIDKQLSLPGNLGDKINLNIINGACSKC